MQYLLSMIATYHSTSVRWWLLDGITYNGPWVNHVHKYSWFNILNLQLQSKALKQMYTDNKHLNVLQNTMYFQNNY